VTDPGDAVDPTAIAVAACRAIETSRPDALITDPWALALVEAAGARNRFPVNWPSPDDEVSPFDEPLLLGSIYIGMRTRLIDDELSRAQGQVVILGAGLDTRAARLPVLSHLPVFEVDRAPTLALKDAVVGTAWPPRRVAVGADVTGEWAVAAARAGFDQAVATSWVLEGLLPYLASADQRRLLDAVAHLSAPGSRAVIERAVPIDAGAATEERLQHLSSRTGVPMADLVARADPPDPVTVLRDAGWQVTEHSVADLERRFGRSLRQDGSSSESRGGFLTAELPARA
jgi:methyltransferase (TIGR00027 family)